jgi:septation ring formation regulator EzrA
LGEEAERKSNDCNWQERCWRFARTSEGNGGGIERLESKLVEEESQKSKVEKELKERHAAFSEAQSRINKLEGEILDLRAESEMLKVRFPSHGSSFLI